MAEVRGYDYQFPNGLRLWVKAFRYRGWGYIPPGTHKELFSLDIGRLPGRKSHVLYATAGASSKALAYFRDEESAQLAIALMESLFIKRDPDSGDGQPPPV